MTAENTTNGYSALKAELEGLRYQGRSAEQIAADLNTPRPLTIEGVAEPVEITPGRPLPGSLARLRAGSEPRAPHEDPLAYVYRVDVQAALAMLDRTRDLLVRLHDGCPALTSEALTLLGAEIDAIDAEGLAHGR